MAKSVDAKRKMKKKTGRPPAGRDELGRPVPVSTDYKQTTLRLRPATKAALDALALIKGKDRSSIVDEALERLVSSLPPADRVMIEQIRKRTSSTG